MNEKLSFSTSKKITSKYEEQGVRLQQARNRKEITGEQLYTLLCPESKLSNASKRATVSIWETSPDRGIPKKHIARLAEILDVTVAFLNCESEYMNQSDKINKTVLVPFTDSVESKIGTIKSFIDFLEKSGHSIKPLITADMNALKHFDSESTVVFATAVSEIYKEKINQSFSHYVFGFTIDGKLYDIGTFEKMIDVTLSNIENTLSIAKTTRKRTNKQA